MFVKDPTVYPIVFKIDRRELSLIDNKFATTTFMCPSGEILQNCFYTYDGSYVTDVDTTSSEDMAFIKDGKASVFEFMADSVSVFLSNFNMRVWVDDSSSTFIKSGENINLRQFPWSSANTSCSFYSSNSMKWFNPEVVSSINYYPSIGVTVSFSPKYYSSFAVTGFSLSPGQEQVKDIINPSNYGIISIICTLSATWYYDEERTLLVATPPEELDFSSKYFSSRIFFVSSGKFNHAGTLDSNGIAIFDGILTKNYVLDHSISYGSLGFIRQRVSTGIKSFDEEAQVIIDDNGYCAKPGAISQVYLLEEGPSSSSSSSSCSSSSSSYSCSSSFSSSSSSV